MFNFDYFLKLSKGLSHLYNFKLLIETDLNRVLCDIIENNMLSVRIIIPQCLFYADYINVFELKENNNFINDHLNHIYLLCVFELFLKIDWNRFFQFLTIGMIIARHEYSKNYKQKQDFIFYLRFTHEILYIEYVFFMRFRYEFNKIFMFLASPFLEPKIYNKYVNLANLDNMHNFTTLNTFSFARCDKNGLFLSKNNVSILSPLFFATLCKPINLTNSQNCHLEYHINFKFYILNKTIRYCKFCDYYADNKEFSFSYKLNRSLNYTGYIDYKNILFFMIYFTKIEIIIDEHIQKRIRRWIMSVEDCFDFQSDKFTKLDEITKNRVELSIIETKNLISKFYVKGIELLDLTSSFYFREAYVIENFLNEQLKKMT